MERELPVTLRPGRLAQAIYKHGARRNAEPRDPPGLRGGPGFAIDCLETLEEIEMENRDIFMAAVGEQFQYVPALNARQEHARFLADLLARHCQGWTHVELGLRPAGGPPREDGGGGK